MINNKKPMKLVVIVMTFILIIYAFGFTRLQNLYMPFIHNEVLLAAALFDHEGTDLQIISVQH